MIKIKLDELNVGYIILGLFLICSFVFYFFNVPGIPYKTQNLILQVPFSAQAPTNNWARNEDCEETSITMANAFLTGTTEDKLPASAAQNAINNLKMWKEANLGYNINTGVEATTKMAEGAFGLKIKQLPNFTIDELKQALINKHPILLPINARMLGNKQYENDGPTYHIIVIRGFKGNTFIVNDPGTNNGDGNLYSFTVLQKASADWNNITKTMDPTRKIALVISK